MPNTPSEVQAGISAIALGRNVSREDERLARAVFESVGKVVLVDERLMDAVTGLSGSGPAYIFLIIEALADGGVKMGLPREAALALAAQTVLGRSEEHTSELQSPCNLVCRILLSEKHTSELQSPCNLVCRLLLEKKNMLVARAPDTRNVQCLWIREKKHTTGWSDDSKARSIHYS